MIVESLEALGHDLTDAVIVGLDLREIDFRAVPVSGALFIGCKLGGPEVLADLVGRGAGVFPGFKGLPYDPYRYTLYTWQELMQGFTPERDDSVDRRIYEHTKASGRIPPLQEALARRIHDHAIDMGVVRLLNRTPLKVVGIMGGHGALRTDKFYGKTLELAHRLTQRGYFVTTGGGPGVMEAGNLGAWLAKYPADVLPRVQAMLAEAPHYTDAGYLGTSLRVLEAYPEGSPSLAVPTWFYGHEPSNLFATSIAKYFSNSIREDGLLAMCVHGIIYAPGSAGTTQEIFQDATQNHYGTFEWYSPMVFLGRQRYTEDTAIFPLLEQLSKGRAYHDMLHVSDDPADIVAFLESHPPVKV